VRLVGKVAIVTGGASGIGREIAEMFVREGAKVVVGDIHGLLWVNMLGEDGVGEAIAQRADVRKEADVKGLIQQAMDRWQRLDIIVNNAGIGLNRDVTETSEDEFDAVFAVNVKGVFFGCKYAVPAMLVGGGGSIINLSSNGGLIGRPGDPVYCASKHAVMGLTKALAVAYASHNIRVNALCPGPIDTPMLWAGTTTQQDRREALPAKLASCPAARYGSPGDVASAALFLASDESRFINGVGLAVDGAKAAGVMPTDRYRLDFVISS
jgi:NAD(P)-dependent dehydrogenase (short-subunit alcohol dehydrogenase family)